MKKLIFCSPLLSNGTSDLSYPFIITSKNDWFDRIEEYNYCLSIFIQEQNNKIFYSNMISVYRIRKIISNSKYVNSILKEYERNNKLIYPLVDVLNIDNKELKRFFNDSFI